MKIKINDSNESTTLSLILNIKMMTNSRSRTIGNREYLLIVGRFSMNRMAKPHIPGMANVLTIDEPMIAPVAILLLSDTATLINVVKNSGDDVPNAIKVEPDIFGDMSNTVLKYCNDGRK
ncbi:hypothetical protein BLOT_016658 [Blomia tropicalis]|nr:hypothetical protein BLOT_016658 [Blomia tropicalis]